MVEGGNPNFVSEVPVEERTERGKTTKGIWLKRKTVSCKTLHPVSQLSSWFEGDVPQAFRRMRNLTDKWIIFLNPICYIWVDCWYMFVRDNFGNISYKDGCGTPSAKQLWSLQLSGFLFLYLMMHGCVLGWLGYVVRLIFWNPFRLLDYTELR